MWKYVKQYTCVTSNEIITAPSNKLITIVLSCGRAVWCSSSGGGGSDNIPLFSLNSIASVNFYIRIYVCVCIWTSSLKRWTRIIHTHTVKYYSHRQFSMHLCHMRNYNEKPTTMHLLFALYLQRVQFKERNRKIEWKQVKFVWLKSNVHSGCDFN